MQSFSIVILFRSFILLLAFINTGYAETTLRNAANAIARAQFTSAMENKEPTDNVVLISSNTEQIYFFTEIKNYAGGKITHRWEYQGEVVAEVTFPIDGPRWRIYSSKKLKPQWTGIWSVIVLDEKGSPLKISSFEVLEP